MRVSVEIDDALIEKAVELSGLSSRRATIEEALRLLVRLRQQSDVRALFGKVPVDINLDESRQGRCV
jgi:Arc/MetJ family transcription regulator